jgi:hypothetical protein
MIITTDGINDATCGQVSRLEKLGFSGEIKPFVYGYTVSLHTKEYERVEQKTCKDIYELMAFLEAIA